MTAPAPVGARPVRTARVSYALAVVVLVVFVVVAAVMRRDNAGAAFNGADQVGTVIVGVILALLCTIPARPRLLVDADGVHVRQFLGGWRAVPWDLVVRVEFPRSARFARLVLPGEELIGLYAVQRWDAHQAVAVMAALRDWHAATRHS
jgi:hypothetical protein